MRPVGRLAIKTGWSICRMYHGLFIFQAGRAVVYLLAAAALLVAASPAAASGDVVLPDGMAAAVSEWAGGGTTDAELRSLLEALLEEGAVPAGAPGAVPPPGDWDGVLPLWFRERAQWWAEGRISDAQLAGSVHQLAGPGRPAGGDGGLLPDGAGIYGITGDHRWRVLVSEDGGDGGPARAVFRDITRVYEPVFYRFKVPSLVLEADGPGQGRDDPWGQFGGRDAMIERSHMHAVLGPGTECFFDHEQSGAATVCAHGGRVLRVVLFDAYGEHYEYGGEGFVPGADEPTIRIAGEILARMGAGGGRGLLGAMDRIEPAAPAVQEPAGPAYPMPPGTGGLEGSAVQGVAGLACERDDFGTVAVAGRYNNGAAARDAVELSVSFVGADGSEAGTARTVLYDLGPFETRRFAGQAAWDEAFSGCTASAR